MQPVVVLKILIILDELGRRQQFLDESGIFLPGDLWPGLLDPPTVLEVVSSKDWPIPEVSVKSIAAAKQLLHRS